MVNYLHSLRRRRRKRLAHQHIQHTGYQRVAVIGLGRFGSSLANELMHRGWDVLGIDTDARVRVYHLRPERLIALRAWVDQVQAFWSDQLDAFREHVEGSGR